MGQGIIIGADGKEGWARPYQELTWEILVKIALARRKEVAMKRILGILLIVVLLAGGIGCDEEGATTPEPTVTLEPTPTATPTPALDSDSMADYIYAGGMATRKVWKIRKSDMSKVAESATYGATIKTLAEDNDYIYAAGWSPTRKVWKIQKSDMTKVAESIDPGGDLNALAEDDDYIYTAGYVIQKVWKIQKSDMSKVGESIAYGGTIMALTEDADYVYAAGFTAQKVWKIRYG